MADMKTYQGGCHCGEARFECTTDLAMVTACNCSICTKKGLHYAFVSPESFRMRSGQEGLREYLFHTHRIKHQICTECGVELFAYGSMPDGSPTIAVNVSCFDNIDLNKIKMTPVDGRSM